MTISHVHGTASRTRSFPIVMSVATAAVTFSLVVLALVLLRPVLPIDETRYLSVAWEMWNGSSPIVPHLNGEPYSHKPPLLFWLINLVWGLFGTGSIAARMVPPAFAVLCIMLTAKLSRTLWPDERNSSAMSAWILATSGTFLLYGSLTMFDTMLAAATLAAMLGILQARRGGAWHHWLAVGAAIAFGVLAKGPVILLHVMPVALTMPLWADRRTRPALRTWYAGVGLAILAALAIVSVWLVPALLTGGSEYRYDILWRQHEGRMVAAFAHNQPMWFYLAALPLLTWPWAWSRQVLAALAPTRFVRDESLRFCAAWILGAFLLFSLVSGKQLHYLLPEICGLAIVIANAVYAADRVGTGSSPARPVAALVIPVGLFISLALTKSAWLVPAMASKGLSLPGTALLSGAAILTLLVIVVVHRDARITGWLLTAPATMLMVHVMASPVLHNTYDPAPISQHVATYEEAGIALFEDEYRGEFTYAGRLRQPITPLADEAAVHVWSLGHPGGLLISRRTIEGTWLVSVASYKFRGRTYQLLEVPDLECTPEEALRMTKYE